MRLQHLLTATSMALMLIAFGSMTAVPSLARDAESDRRDAVRRAVETGEVLPLSRILEKVRVRVSGDIMGTDIHREDGHWHYEFRVIDRSGHVLDVHVDAHSGDIERIEEK